jgi:hypothetical protein
VGVRLEALLTVSDGIGDDRAGDGDEDGDAGDAG